jgi:hypothetical protein
MITEFTADFNAETDATKKEAKRLIKENAEAILANA